MAKKEHGGKAECESIRFEPAEGGLVSETAMKYKRGGQGGGPSHDYEHERTIHPTMEHAVSHLKETMGHQFGEKKGMKEPDHEPGEGEE